MRLFIALLNDKRSFLETASSESVACWIKSPEWATMVTWLRMNPFLQERGKDISLGLSKAYAIFVTCISYSDSVPAKERMMSRLSYVRPLNGFFLCQLYKLCLYKFNKFVSCLDGYLQEEESRINCFRFAPVTQCIFHKRFSTDPLGNLGERDGDTERQNLSA